MKLAQLLTSPRLLWASAGMLTILAQSPAQAAVNFTSLASAGLVATPGSTITIDLSLDITGTEEVTGVSYELTQDSGPSTNVFAITGVTGRDASDFSFENYTDAQITSSPGNELDPTNALDLGAGLQDIDSPVSANVLPYPLAVFTLSVSPTAQTGTYDISPTFGSSLPNGDWIGDAADNFDDNNISSQLVIPVTVIAAPEPAVWALLLAGMAFLVPAVRRRTQLAS